MMKVSSLIVATSVAMSRKGATHIGESRIERIHQFQKRDKDSAKRLSDVAKDQELKLKRQVMRNDMAITKISSKVSELSKCKKDGKVIEYKSTKLQKPVMKKIKREKIADEVRNENKMLEYKDPVIIEIE